jgi:hypothetical protein
MSITRNLLALALVLGTGLSFAAGPPANKQKQAKHHAFHGLVVHVHRDKKGPGGRIAVLVRHHQNNKLPGRGRLARARQAHVKHVRVTDATQFEKVALQKGGKGQLQNKGQNQKQPASFADVHKGQHVRIKTGPRGHTALEVDILAHAARQGNRPGKRR